MKKSLGFTIVFVILPIVLSDVSLFAHTIHNAALRGDIAQVHKLLDEGESVNSRDEKGWTPLHYAAAAGHDAVVKLLLDKRASVDARDSDRETPLHKASQLGRNSTVNLLLDRGASVNVQDNQGQTPLHKAGNAGIVKTLINHGADIRSRDYRGRTPLHVASAYGKEDVAKNLVKAGVAISVRDSQGKTAADLAGKKIKDKQMARRIRSFLDSQNKLATTLQEAAAIGDIAGIKTALKAGAPVNTPDNNGNTPLHLAVQSGNAQAVRYLLDVPTIKIRVQNNEGNIPIEEAINQSEMMDLFKKKLSVKVP